MTIINTSPDRIIQLGYEGEDRVTVLRFRYSADWLENGEGVFHIRVRRHGENHAYNAELLTADLTHMELLMTVTNVELSVKGAGEMQVVYSGEDFVKKSPIYSYNVSRAVDEAVDPPAQDVYTQIIESLSDLQTDVSGITEDIGQIENSIGALSALTTAKIGDLTELTTEAKSSLVSAINEVNSKSVDDALSATSTNPVQNKVLTARINSLDSDVGTLRTSVQSKADIQTVSALADAVNGVDSDVQGLQTIVQGKADVQTVTALSDTVSGLQTAMQGKADVQTVTALSGTVSSLSDTTQQYMEYTNSAITDLQDNKASKSYVDGELATKANVQTVTALSGTVTDLQANKADKTYVDTELAGKASTAVATTSSDGLMSAQDKSKLDEVGLLKEQIYNSYPNVEAETASVVSITDGADDIPVKSLVVGVEPVQDLHGYDSPWPAGGGKNQYSGLIGNDEFINNGRATHSNDNGTLVIVTDAGASASGVYIPQTGEVRKAIDACSEPLTVSMDVVASAEGNVRIVFCGTQQLFSVLTSKQRLSVTATSKTTANFNIYGVNNGAVLRVSNLQIESGSTATSYTPYSNICPITGWTGAKVYHSGSDMSDPETISISFPSSAGTVYGGSLDVTNGVLTVDRANLNLVDATALMQNNGVRNGNQLISVKVQGKKYGESNFASDIFQINVSIAGMYMMHGRAATSVVEFEIPFSALGVTESDSVAVRLEAARQWFVANEPQLVYELATPITIQLTPIEIRTLLGQNNIFADTGDTSLAYRADTKLYVDGICADCNSMLAPVESTYIATRNYTTGQLLIVDNTLYKVTANIANGGTITAGTNVVATTLSEVIASLS